MTTTGPQGGSAVPERHQPTRAIAALLLGAALVMGACSTNREITKPPPEKVTTENLAATLLTTADLPEGFTQKEGAGAPISTEIVPEHECDDPLKDVEPKLAASRDFSGNGVQLTDTAAWFPGQGQAAEQVYRNLASACTAVVVPKDGLSIRTGALDFGVLSDKTLAIRIEVEPTSGPILERDLIVMRQGDLLHVIRVVGPRPSDKLLLDTATRVTIGRLGLLYNDVNP